ncbi:MAG: hypothetical protein ABIZ91_08760 [Gemmatimonadaceae bacterium]
MTDKDKQLARQPASTPATFDRGALERVLARAAELQAGHSERSDAMSEAELIDVGNQVGIPADLVRQALAEERTRVTVPEATGVVGEYFGSSIASASRIVRGQPAQLLSSIDQWMQREESLRPKRRMTDRLTWEARRDIAGTIQVGLNLRGRAYALAQSNEVGATVISIDAERSMVRLDADFGESRRRKVRWSAVVGGGMFLSAAALVAITIVVPGSSAIVGGIVGSAWAASGAGIAAAIAAGQRKRVARAQLSLDQILDQLEHNQMPKPASPLSGFLDVVAKTVDGLR